MSDAFDPYYKWLGIPPAEQPANHYRLLGIKRLENDLDVIENAADRQMMHLRTMKTGKNAALSQKLLNEVSAAKLELLEPKKKEAYDERLQAQRKSPVRKPRKSKSVSQATETGDAATFTNPANADLAPNVANHSRTSTAYRKSRKKSSHSSQMILGGVLAAGLAIVLIVVATTRREPNKPVVHKQQRSVSQKLPSTKKQSPEKKSRRDRKRGKRKDREFEPSDRSGEESTPPLEFNVPEESPDPTQPTDEPEETPPTESEPTEENSPQEEAPQPETVEKHPLPLEDQQAEAVARVREAFQVQQARTAEEKVGLAKTLIRQSKRPGSPSERFALLDEARNLAVQGTDFELALQATEALGQAFQADPFLLAAKSLAAVRIPSSEMDRNQQLVSLGIEWMKKSAAEENYEAALKLGETAAATARRIRDIELAKHVGSQVSNYREAQKSHLRALEARAALQSDPNNEDAHLQLGKHLCLVRGDWERGLAHLAKSADARLQLVAQADLNSTDDVEQQTKIAQAWSEAAKRASGLERTALAARAELWFRKALPLLSGVDKANVERQLRELEPASSSQTFQRSAPTRGLVAHWEFDEGKGPIVGDSIGQGHGRLDGATWSQGVLKGSLSFDGQDDSVLVPNLGVLQAFTLAVWVRPADRDGENRRENPILGNSDLNLGSIQFYLRRSGEVEMAVRGAFGNEPQGLFRISSQGQVLRGSWQHIAVTYDVSSRSSALMIDGKLDSTHNYRLAVPVQFGPGRMGGWVLRKRGQFYAGEMDDLRIYDRVLSAEEVSILYESGAPR